MPEEPDLLHTVEAEFAAVQRFVGLLEREQAMLVDGAVDDLLDLVEEKNALAGELAALADRHGRLLTAEGLSADRSGVAAWFSAHPGESRVRTAWSQLLPLARQARELNRLNGELIRVRLQHNAGALAALLGASVPGLYGRDGQNMPQVPDGQRISDTV